MPVTKQVTYKADDGKYYNTIEEAQRAQTAFTKQKAAREARQKQAAALTQVFAQLNQNSQTNANIVSELLLKPSVAVQLRDGLNRVVDYHRRNGRKGA